MLIRVPQHLPTRLRLFLIALGAVVLLTGCITLEDHEASQEQRQEVVATVSETETFSQVFVARRRNLNGIQLWFQVPGETPPSQATLSARISADPQSDVVLGSGVFLLKDIQSSGTVQIPLPSQPDSAGRSYFLRLEVTGGRVEVLGRNGGVYPQGAAFSNKEPIEGDAAFRLTYLYDRGSVFEDLLTLLQFSWLVIPLGVLLWLPGRLLLDWGDLSARFDWGERLALSVALSLALIPIVMTWTTLVGIRWSQAGAIIVAICLVILAAARRWFQLRFEYQSRQTAPNTAESHGEQQTNPGEMETTDRFSVVSLTQRRDPYVIGLGLTAIFLFSLFVRVAMVRDLSAPAWVDSVHHGMFTRLIQQYGGYPDSYAPYMDIQPGSYHLGFHSGLAFFLWLSGLDLPLGMLIFGQVLNALTVLAVYLFTTRLTNNRVAGLFAALISGVFTPMPAYYTSWGRYTHLVGLLILPAAFTLFKLWLDRLGSPMQNALDRQVSTRRWRLSRQQVALLVSLAIVSGGLFLTHLRVLAFLAALFFVMLLFQAIRAGRHSDLWHAFLEDLVFLTLAVSLSLILVFPWIPPTFSNLLLPKLATWRGGNAVPFGDFTWNYLTTALGRLSLALAGIGAIWGLLRKKWLPLVLALWVALMFLMANLDALNLPGSSFVNNTAVAISLFIPIAVLGGYLVGDVILLAQGHLPGNWRFAPVALALIGAVFAAIVGFRLMLPLLNPVTFLFRSADRPALAWIESHLPAGETVLVNPFAWGYGLYAGTDGGYWMSSLTDNPSMPPPVLYGLSNDPQTVQTVNQISQRVIEGGTDPQAIYDLMVEQGIDYLYIGGRGGPLPAGALRASELFIELYGEGGVYVLRRK